jgi:hypothetical protein
MEELRDKLINIINECNLPIEGIYYIFKDVFRELSDQYSIVLQKERQEKILQEEITENKEQEKED